MSRLVIFLIASMAFYGLPLVGQSRTGNFEVRHVTTKDGLSSPSVTAVKQDLQGLLWIGTISGLNAFDGHRVEPFEALTSPSGQLLHPRINDLELGPDGLLFVCTPTGARVIDPVLRQYVAAADIGIPDSLLEGHVHLEKSASGGLLLLRGTRVYQLQLKATGRYTVQIKYTIPFCSPYQLLLDKSGPDHLWIITEGCAVLRVRPGGVQQMNNIYKKNQPPETVYLHLRHFHVLKDNSLWDQTRNIFRLLPKSDTLKCSTNYTPVDDFPGLLTIDSLLKYGRSILTCTSDYEAEQHIYGTTNGLFILRKKNKTLFKGEEKLRGEEIRGIYSEPNGRWWVGTYSGFYSGNSNNSTITKDTLRPVWQMLPLKDSTILVTTEVPNGIAILNKNSGVHKRMKVISDLPPSIMHTGAIAACQDFQGGLWTGTYTHLMYAAPQQPFIFKRYEDPITGASFQRSMVRLLFTDRDSSIWAGTEDGLYHFVFDPKVNRFRIDLAPSYIPGISISHIYQDKFGILWVATKGKGVARINKQTGDVRWLNTTHGLCNNITCRIESSHNDRVLWISTHNGLSRYDVLDQFFENYYEEDGLIGNEFNTAASHQSHSGSMYFGGVNGLTAFHPDSIKVTRFQYKTILLPIKVYDAESNTILSLAPHNGNIQLPPYPEYIEIPLASTELIQAEKVNYRYRLLGLSDKWTYTNGEHEIKFIRLPPGAYKFEAQALPPLGHFGSIQRIDLLVQMPFYESWWFYTCCILTVGLLALGVHFYRIHQLEKEQIIRRQIADDLHDDIGNKLNIISILAQKIAISSKLDDSITHQTALQKLISASKETLSSLHTMIWTIDAQKGRLSDLVMRMQDFADDYLVPLHIPCTFDIQENLPTREMKLRIRHHLLLLYQEILTNMVKHNKPKKITIQIRLDGPYDLVLTITNIFHTEASTPLMVSSTNRGGESIKHRLFQINGRLLHQETNFEKQIIKLSLPLSFK